MQRRTLLLFLLFLVLAAFYAAVTQENVPRITGAQQEQTESLNQLDERVLGPVREEVDNKDR